MLSCLISTLDGDFDRSRPFKCASKVAKHALLLDLDADKPRSQPFRRHILSLEYFYILTEILLLLSALIMIDSGTTCCNGLRALLVIFHF